MAAAIGADVEQLRSLAKQFTQGADRLEQASSGLGRVIGAAAYWRGNDADQFRTRWRSQSTPSITAAVKTLRTAAEALAHNADEQDQASAAGGGITPKTDDFCLPKGFEAAQDPVGPAGPPIAVNTGTNREIPESEKESNRATSGDPLASQSADGLHDMWNEIHDIPSDSSGYRVEEVVGPDNQRRYIVYIVGTFGSSSQTLLSNIDAHKKRVDSQIAALNKLIPEDAEVMLVGYSQGGMDAQNIAASGELKAQVKEIVTFGSPVRNDLNIPAIHLQESRDPIPNVAAPGASWSTDGDPQNTNVQVFRGKSDLKSGYFVFDVKDATGMKYHADGYDSLSAAYDNAVDRNLDLRAVNAAADLDKFQGTINQSMDINQNSIVGVGNDGQWYQVDPQQADTDFKIFGINPNPYQITGEA